MIRSVTGLLSLALLVAGSCRPAFGAQPVQFKPAADHIEVLIGERPFTFYHFDSDTAKPYLFPLRSAQGTIVTRGFPMDPNIAGEDHDEPHQRAMYFAHGDINGYDFWGEAAFPRWSRHSRATFGRICPRTGRLEASPRRSLPWAPSCRPPSSNAARRAD